MYIEYFESLDKLLRLDQWKGASLGIYLCLCIESKVSVKLGTVYSLRNMVEQHKTKNI